LAWIHPQKPHFSNQLFTNQLQKPTQMDSYNQARIPNISKSSESTKLESGSGLISRPKPKSQVMVLPLRSSDEKRSIEKLTFCFGDLFVPSNSNTIVTFPYFRGGVLFDLWEEKNGVIDPHRNPPLFESFSLKTMDGLLITKSKTVDVDFGVAFRYKGDQTKWGLMFEELAKTICEFYQRRADSSPSVVSSPLADLSPLTQTTLVIPTIGTNNGFHFYKSAYGILFGLIKQMKNPDSFLNKFKEIRVLTPWNQDQMGTSARSISHIFALIDNNVSVVDDEKKCIACLINKADINCSDPFGSRIVNSSCGPVLCHSCVHHVGFNCPCCNGTVIDVPKTPRIDASEFVCCGDWDHDPNNKVKEMFNPCGHTNAVCKSCYNGMVSGNYASCPVCHNLIASYASY